MRALMLLAALGVAACSPSGPSAETIAAERAAVAADAAARAEMPAAPAPQPANYGAVSAQPATIDPPANTGATRIVSRDAIRGGSACAITVAYAGAVEQEATWAHGPCSEVRLIAVSRLEDIGQLDDLPEEAALDIRRSPGGQVLYAESEFTSSVFPLNVVGRIYEVSLSD